MKNIHAFLAVATYILLCLSSCKKHHDAPIDVQFDPEGLAYVQLPLNKYFIYKDSASGTLDSVVVTDSKVEKLFVPAFKDTMGSFWNVPAMNTESFTLVLSKFNGPSKEDWLYAQATAFAMRSGNDGLLFLYEKDRNTNSKKGVGFAFINPYDNSQVLPSITIEGKTYSSVKIDSSSVDYSRPAEPTYHRRTYYWAKGIGIIKREVRTFNSVKTDLLVRSG